MLLFLLRSKTNTFRKLDIRNVGGFRYDIIVGYRYHIFGFGFIQERKKKRHRQRLKYKTRNSQS